jgi:hypothetical protein
MNNHIQLANTNPITKDPFERSTLRRGFLLKGSKLLSILALTAIMSELCFGAPCGVPKPAASSICATAAIQTPPPNDNDPFISPTTINGFVITSLGNAFYNLAASNLLGLQFDTAGLTIRLPHRSNYALVEVGAFSLDVLVEGFDIHGILVASVTVPHTGTSTAMVAVSGRNLETIKLSQGNNEGVVFSICAWQ